MAKKNTRPVHPASSMLVLITGFKMMRERQIVCPHDRLKLISLGVLYFLLVFTGYASAEQRTSGHNNHQEAKASLLAECHEPSALPSVHCGRSPSIAMDEQGTAYIVFSQHGHVYLTTSADFGKTYRTPVAVNTRPEAIYDDGENRPKIVVGKDSQLYVSWTHKTPGRYSGDVRFSRSLDGGQNFSEPVTINSDKQLISHRFDTLVQDDSGRLYIFWIDKRDQVQAKKTNEVYPGAAIYYRYSDDQGASFQPDIKWVDQSCECCRIAAAVDKRGKVAILWRHVFPGNIRDHAISYVEAEMPAAHAKPVRATQDNWHLEGCPHHGPDLSFDANHRAHMVWFTQGDVNKGLVYGQYDFARQETTSIKSIDARPSSSRPQVQVHGQKVFILWKRFNADKMELMLLRSPDTGKTWDAEQIIASTHQDSDHPDLISAGAKLFATWHTQAEGLRWMELN
jgi:hypothetical protein